MKLITSTKLILVMYLLSFSFTFCFQTETEEKLENRNTINISEGSMKHRKMRIKATSKKSNTAVEAAGNTGGTTATTTGGTTGSTTATTTGSTTATTTGSTTGTTNTPTTSNTNTANTSTSTSTTSTSNTNKNSSTQSSAASDDTIPDGPIVYTAWIKYFHYSESEHNGDLPKHFFKNNQYFEQKKLFPKANMSETSSDGVSTLYSYIQSPSHFYAVMFRNNINFLSSRHAELQKTYDTLSIDGIRPVQETRGLPGAEEWNNNSGIQEFGNFSEGFCFKIVSARPRPETWILCADTQEEKNKLMLILKKIKIQTQREAGVILAPGMQKKPETISDLLTPGGSQANCKEEKGSKADGYWIVLQDWTQCSLKCGGGTSTMQRLCVPPKNGGAACEGEAVITKACNTQPCPEMQGPNGSCNGLNNTNNVVMKPVVKVMPFSSRPQRYSKCVIKESDLMLTQDNSQSGSQDNPLLKANTNQIAKIQIPVRVVMNTHTVSIFSGDEYTSQVLTFNMRDTFFHNSPSNKNCFILSENVKHAELCPFGFNTEGKSMIDEWDFDFSLFKFQCFKPKEKMDVNKKFEDDMNKKLNDKIKNAKKELLDEREDSIKKSVEKEEEAEIEGVVKKTNQVALQALQRELNLEAMIKREEAERERKEEQEIIKRIDEEKKKGDCLMKAIKERQLENQNNLRAKEAEEEVNSIKKSASDQVTMRREQLKLQIMQMRKKAQRRKASLAQTLQTVRMSMADTMNKVYKKGDGSKCQNAMQNENNRNIYCQASFPDDYSSLTTCKEGDDFCMFCCDNEFGDMFANERHNCYQTYCPKPNMAGAEEDKNGDPKGRWIWQNEMK